MPHSRQCWRNGTSSRQTKKVASSSDRQSCHLAIGYQFVNFSVVRFHVQWQSVRGSSESLIDPLPTADPSLADEAFNQMEKGSASVQQIWNASFSRMTDGVQSVSTSASTRMPRYLSPLLFTQHQQCDDSCSALPRFTTKGLSTVNYHHL